jgi:hypothetical protein
MYVKYSHIPQITKWLSPVCKLGILYQAIPEKVMIFYVKCMYDSSPLCIDPSHLFYDTFLWHSVRLVVMTEKISEENKISKLKFVNT